MVALALPLQRCDYRGGSNVVNITSLIGRGGSCELKPADFHVDFDLTIIMRMNFRK